MLFVTLERLCYIFIVTECDIFLRYKVIVHFWSYFNPIIASSIKFNVKDLEHYMYGFITKMF